MWLNSVMAKAKEATSEFSARKLKALRLRLELVCSDLQRAEEIATDAPLWCFKEYSAEKAADMLDKFAADLRKSVYAKESGIPYSHASYKSGNEVITPATQVSTSKLSEIPGVHIASSDQLPASEPDDDGIDQPLGKPTKKKAARKSQSQAKSTPKRKSG